ALERERPGPAFAVFEGAVAGAPRHTGAWTNRGRALQTLNRHADAVASFEKAIALDKNFADAHSNMALSLLTLGHPSRGFAEYEWRWKRTGMTDARRDDRGRPWLGEFPLGQRTILLAAEQGLGDSIQFVRYAPLLAHSGARVVLKEQPDVKTLLASVGGVASSHARGGLLPAYDVYCPLGSLPLAFKTGPATIPADIPYLRADDAHLAKWRPIIETLPGKRVALTWAGHAKHPNDRNRSIALAQLEPLLALDGISFISVQRDLRADDAAILARHKSITHIGDRLDDMADTAAVLALADLTIAVDTSVIHLAGAMGREAWVMLPFSPDWRWTLTGDHSPWYPRMRLFRQAKPGDWPGVIASLRDALRAAPG